MKITKLTYFIINKFQKDKAQAIKLEPISINLLTSVHPNLSWNFKPVEPKINVKPGEVITVEYVVENFGNKETTGIATFVYFPNEDKNKLSIKAIIGNYTVTVSKNNNLFRPV